MTKKKKVAKQVKKSKPKKSKVKKKIAKESAKKATAKQHKSKKTAKDTKKSTRVTNKNKADKQRDNKKKRVVGRPWKKGQSGNPKGRPPLGLSQLDNLTRAITEVERESKKDLLKHFVKRAFSSDTVLIAVMKKRHPDLKSIQMEVKPQDENAKQRQAELRKKYIQRFQPPAMEIVNLRKEVTRLKYEAEQRGKE